MFRTILSLTIALTFIFSNTSNAQPPLYSADKIIGIIGTRHISQHDLTSYYNQAKTRNIEDPTTQCDIMGEFIMQKVLAEMAVRDSLLITEEQLNSEVDDRIRAIENEYGSRDIMEKYLGMSVYQIKDMYKDDIHESLLAENMRAKIFQSVQVTPEEVKATFDNMDKSEIEFIKASVEIGQIIINPKPSAEAEEFAKSKLEGIRKDIVENNKDFSMMAGIHSEDPGTRNDGGEMTAIKDELDPAFASNIFRLKDGETSPVFRSSFGYHIVYMIKRTGNIAQFKHILITPQLTSEDFKNTQKLLDSIKVELDAKRLTYNQAVDKYSNDDFYKGRGGMYIVDNSGNTELPLEKIDNSTVQYIQNMKVGDFSEPHIFSHVIKNARGMRILYLKNRTDPHEANLKDDYTKFQNLAKQQKSRKELEKFIIESSKTLYIRLDEKFKDCEIYKLIVE